MRIFNIEDLDIEGRRVFIRVDFNVPMNNGLIQDYERILAAIPTIKHALTRNAHVILASHLGQPEKADPAFSLRPIARELSNLLRRPVLFAREPVGREVERMLKKLGPSEVLLLENLRFHPGEVGNDYDFARTLASYAHVYVNDAFGACHRRHASIVTLPRLLKDRGMGYLLQKEVEYLKEKLAQPEKPFVIVFGGAKAKEKIPAIRSLLPRSQSVLIGGVMAYTFLKAMGIPVGQSKVNDDQIPECVKILEEATKLNVQIHLPVDHFAARRATRNARPILVEERTIPDDLIGLDIGPKTVELFCKVIDEARTTIWNGPMGLYEYEAFSKGTIQIARAIAANRFLTIVGGGDSIAALRAAGAIRGVTHVSTGGGAMLEFLAKGNLPGIQSLET
jgi:phosphoglycerate kinase